LGRAQIGGDAGGPFGEKFCEQAAGDGVVGVARVFRRDPGPEGNAFRFGRRGRRRRAAAQRRGAGGGRRFRRRLQVFARLLVCAPQGRGIRGRLDVAPGENGLEVFLFGIVRQGVREFPDPIGL